MSEQIDAAGAELAAMGADHPYVELLTSAPGIGWVLGDTIASEIGDISRFSAPKKLVGYTGLCPKVKQSGGTDRRGPLAKNGPKHLRWALIEAATHAARHPSLPPSASGASAARRSPGSRWPASSPTPSGTCARTAPTSLRFWLPDSPFLRWTAGVLPSDLILDNEAIER